MPYTESWVAPPPSRFAGGIWLSAKRLHTLSRRFFRGTSSKEPSIRRRQATLTHGPRSPPSLSSFPSRRSSAFGGLEPEGPSSPRPGQRLLLAMRHHGCVRSTPAIHISKMSTSGPPGYGDHSPWVTQFTPRGSLRPARAPLRSPVRRPGRGTGRSSDASVAPRSRGTTPAIRNTKAAFPADP